MSTAIIGFAFALAAVFPLATLRTPPQSAPGRAVLTFSIIVTVILGLAFARQLGYAPPGWMRNVVYLAIVVGLVVLDVTLLKTQTKRGRRRAEDDLAGRGLP